MKYILLLTTCIFFIISDNLFGQERQDVAIEFKDLYELESERLLQGPILSGSLKIGMNSKGHLYVLDFSQLFVVVYDNELKVINQFGREGKGPGEFVRPTDLYIDENDNVLVMDAALYRVNIFDASGSIIETMSFQNRATDMVVVNDLLCLHSGGTISKDGNTVDCFSYPQGVWQKSLIEKSQVIGERPIGFANATFHLIQKTEDHIIILQHPLDGTIYVFDKEAQLEKKFTLKNKIFEQPDFPKSYNPMNHKLEDYVSSTISGIHVVGDTIMIIFIEYGTGSKYLDIYNTEGVRIIDEVIFLDRTWPAYADKDGNLYSISYAENDLDLNLKKFRLINSN